MGGSEIASESGAVCLKEDFKPVVEVESICSWCEIVLDSAFEGLTFTSRTFATPSLSSRLSVLIHSKERLLVVYLSSACAKTTL